MKTKFFHFLMLASLAISCQTPFDSLDETNSGAPTAFEGKWTWLKTDGSGVAGPYHADSTTVGYSMIYQFGSTLLQVYKDGVMVEQHTYTYTVSGEPDKQRLTLKNKTNGAEAIFLWELKNIDNKNYLFLRNVEPCCDNTFEHQFKLIAR